MCGVVEQYLRKSSECETAYLEQFCAAVLKNNNN